MAASEWKDTMVSGRVGGYNDSRSMGRSTKSCDSWLWPVSTA